MDDAFVLGVDVGTTNLKVLALNRAGKVVGRASAGYQVCAVEGGFVSQDPGEWLAALDTCLASMKAQCSLSTLLAIGISAQGETLICCDARNNPLDSAISWMDTRAASEACELMALRDDWQTLTGKPVAAYSTLAKIRWIQKHQPSLFNRVARFCQVADFVVAELTGEWLLDVNNASFTSLFNVRQRCWDTDLVGQFGLFGKLPDIKESGSVAGVLRPGLVSRWGLQRAPRVVLGGHDQGCAAIGANVAENHRGQSRDCGMRSNHSEKKCPPSERAHSCPPSEILLSTGTAWVLYACMPEPRFAPSSRAITYCHARPDSWAALAAFSGGGALDAFASRFLRQNGVAPAYTAIESDGNLKSDLLVLPYFFGANAPSNDPLARAAIVNLGPAHGPEQVFYSLMESVGFETRRNLVTFAEMGIACERLIMTGGATRSAVWPQIVADACGIPVHVCAEPDAAAVGAAMLAGESAGLWSKNFAAAEHDPVVVKPGEDKHRLDAKYRQYLNAVAMDQARRSQADAPAMI
jgi:xylulokinase